MQYEPRKIYYREKHPTLKLEGVCLNFPIKNTPRYFLRELTPTHIIQVFFCCSHIHTVYHCVNIVPLWVRLKLPPNICAIASLMVNAGANAFANTPTARMPRMTITDFCNLISCLMVLLVISASKGLLIVRPIV